MNNMQQSQEHRAPVETFLKWEKTSVYFRDQLRYPESTVVSINLSQSQFTEIGQFVGDLYYRGILDDYFHRNQIIGYPHNGGLHTLTIRSTVDEIRSFLKFLIDVINEQTEFLHRQEGMKQFVTLLERKLAEVYF